jgi:sterol desaturase/sphingolipid hydroxylase (fatty acid hydroxylase superfamily)
MLVIAAVMLAQVGGFFAMGLAIHYWFFVRNRELAAAWKHQPDRFQTRAQMLSKLPLVLLNACLISFMTGVAVMLSVEGKTQAYWSASECGWAYSAITPVLCGIWYHVALYYFHRWMHTPAMHRRFHHLHHKFKAPMFLDALYEHPVEAFYGGLVITAPLFMFPVWGVGYFIFLGVMGLHELLDHTGVRLDIPLLAKSKAHDEHHRRYNGYYGQLLPWLDAWHRTDTAKPAPLKGPG